MEGRSAPEEYAILKELSSLKADVEWHLVQADFDLTSCSVGPESGKAWCSRIGPASPARAIEQVSDDQVQEWISSGQNIEVLPGRGVPTEKPASTFGGAVRNKYRAVICGNFQKPGQSYYAGGADSISIRTVLRWGGLRSFQASEVDIKTAFLNAPVDSSEPEFLICNPPRRMVAAGVVPPRTKWRVKGALYGLVSSPRSWSIHRDKVLRSFQWSCGSRNRVARQCVPDPNVWRIVDSETSALVALMTCYVDDILVVGPMEERMAFLECLRSTWETSVPEHSETS